MVFYQLTYHDRNKKYVGQTDRPLFARLQEHFRDFKYGNGKFMSAKHIIDNRHSIAPMEDIMEILHIINKGSMLNTVEGSHA